MLSLNINKTNYMIFGKDRVASDTAIAITKTKQSLWNTITWYNYRWSAFLESIYVQRKEKEQIMLVLQ